MSAAQSTTAVIQFGSGSTIHYTATGARETHLWQGFHAVLGGRLVESHGARVG